MTTFTFHTFHEGPYYGFLHGLVAEDGTELEEVVPNLYKLSVKNESITRVRVLISAEESPHVSPFSEVAGSARTLGWGWGSVHMAGVTDTDSPVELSVATVTLTNVLDDGGRELISNLGGPVTLTVTSGGSSSIATFVNTGRPEISMTVLALPLIGQVTWLSVHRADVGRPSSCGWFGSATLATEFTIDDGTNPSVSVRGEDQWTCTPFWIWNL